MNKIAFAYYSDLNGLPIKMNCEYTPLYLNDSSFADGDSVLVNTIEVNHADTSYNIIQSIKDSVFETLCLSACEYFKENYELTVTAKMKV